MTRFNTTPATSVVIVFYRSDVTLGEKLEGLACQQGSPTEAGGVVNTPRTTSPVVIFMPGLLSGGGAERYAVGLATAIRKGSHAVVVATDFGDRDAISAQFGVDLDGITLAHLPRMATWTHRLPHAIFALLEDYKWTRALRKLRPSVFVNCLYRSEVPGVGSRTNLYVCHFPHPLDQRYSPASRALYMQAVASLRRLFSGRRPFLTTYDRVLANSSFTAEHVKNRWQHQATVLYPPCPPMLVADQPKQRRIVAVGRFEAPVSGVPNKRLDVLVKAFAAMTDLHEQGWELHIAGACPERSASYVDDLHQMAGTTPVHVHPNLPYADLQQLYSSSTIYWHAQGYGEDADARPETQEHFGITTVEAMSAGAIPVVIDTAGPREVVLPVLGAERWTTPAELQAATRRIAAMGEAERAVVAAACRERAAEFDVAAFETRLSALLAED